MKKLLLVIMSVFFADGWTILFEILNCFLGAYSCNSNGTTEGTPDIMKILIIRGCTGLKNCRVIVVDIVFDGKIGFFRFN